MAIPVSAYFSTFDVTSRTEKQVLDAKLWGIMQPKVPALDLISKGSEIDSTRLEWEYRKPDVKYATAGASNYLGTTTATTFDLADAATFALMEVGTVLRDTAVGKGVGTHKSGELIMVTAIGTSPNVTVKRNLAEPTGSTADTGVAHAASAVWEIMYTPRQESSDAGKDMFLTLGIMENYTVTQDFYLTISGSQKKRAMNNLPAASQLQMQWEDRLMGAARRIESALFYGTKASTLAGSDTVIRQMAGVQQAMSVAGSTMVDYTTTTLNAAALNKAFLNILKAGGDTSDPYVVFCSPEHGQTISAFGDSYIKIAQSERQYGHYITSFLSDLGYTAQIVPTVSVHQNDLFVLNTRKWTYFPYRPWFKKAPEIIQDGEVQRAITEFTSQLVDPTSAHFMFTLLT